MIELSLHSFNGTPNEGLNALARIIEWLTMAILEKQSAEDSIALNGYISIVSMDGTVSSLLLCDGENQKKIMTLLQQPPGEYKEKYVAYELNNDTQAAVEEEKEEKDEEDEDGSEKGS